MKKLTTLLAVLALLSTTSVHAMQDAGQTGFYDRDETTRGDRGDGGWANSFIEGLKGLLDLSTGGKYAPGKRPKKLKGNCCDPKVDKGKGGNKGNGTRADPTRGGALD